MSSTALDGPAGALYRKMQGCNDAQLPEVYRQFVLLLRSRRGAVSALAAQSTRAGKKVRRRLREAGLLD